jgi:hypothetical protein
MIKYSCGYCGQPLDEDDHDVIDIPDDYDPNKYPHSVCGSCNYEQSMEAQRMRVTREMALDAGDPSLEGEWI